MSEQLHELIDWLHTSQDGVELQQAIGKLAEIGTGREEVINALIDIARSTSDEPTRWVAIESLSKIAVDRSTAIDTLIELLSTSRPPTAHIIARYLPSMIADNSSAVSSLANIARTSEDESIRQAVTDILGKVKASNSDNIEALVYLAYNSSNDTTLLRVISALQHLKAGDQNAILAYLHLMRHTGDSYIHSYAFYVLSELTLDPKVSQLLSQLEESYICPVAIVTIPILMLSGVLMGLLILIRVPTRIVESLPNLSMNIIARFGKFMVESANQIKTLKETLRISKNPLESYLIARRLGGMSLATTDVVQTVLKRLQQEQPPAFRILGYYSIASMSVNNPNCVSILIEFLSNVQDVEERKSIIMALGQVKRKKSLVIDTLTNLISSSSDPSTCRVAIRSLKSVEKGDFLTVSPALDNLAKNHSNPEIRQLIETMKRYFY